MPTLRRNLWLFAAICAACYPIVAYQKLEGVSSPKNLPPGENILWTDPGNVESLDFVNGVGGEQTVPQPPFQFVEEDKSGTNPKVKVKDGAGRTWSVKFGPEAKPSVFATRMAWACGFPVETEYFVTRGQMAGARNLKRARSFIQGDGSFTDARFQLRTDKPKYLDSFNWTWPSNPFLGTPQLNGLKVLVMLLSNWDTKDARDRDAAANDTLADSNLAIFQTEGTGGPRYLYMISDWGATFGRWGPGIRSKFNCRDYSNQTPGFVHGAEKGLIKWGYLGKHNEDIVQGIRTSDVQWLLQYLGRITDDQLRRGLASSGAAPDDVACFTHSIRQRIDQLQAVAKD